MTTMIVVVCQRDPDASNDYTVFGSPAPWIIDVDYGYADLDNADEFAEWRDGHLETVNALYRDGSEAAVAAGRFLANAVADAIERYA